MLHLREIMADMRKAPNWFTLLRILGFFFLIVPLIKKENFFGAFIVFLLLSFTDFFDGQLARRKNMVTKLGKGLDPIADKILLIGTMFALGILKDYFISGLLLVALESVLFVIGIAAFLQKSGNFELGATIFGKTKAVLEIAVIFLVFLQRLDIINVPAFPIIFLLWTAIVAAFLSIVSHLRCFRLLKA